jgi:outer membrane cobalamin receptor
MKKITKILLGVLFIATSSMYGQTLTGTVVDGSNQPLPGADVVLTGTTTGVSTDFNGNFSLDVNTASGTLKVSFIGYASKNVAFNSSNTNLGAIQLDDSAESLDEIVISGIMDIAKDRQTPVAVSTIRSAEILDKLGSQEFPELLNNTPSVYATKQGGGFGDARINIRGFDQRNTAVLINGMPVNDMENGWVYWSNWAGLSDVTSAMQVQRGLGSSKLAISSVGGTINVITRTSEQKEGGSVTASVGNDNYQKYVASYSTGLMDNGFSASLLFSRTTGDGYIQGTAFEGHNYFIGLGQELNDKHSLMFTFTGAPQWHNQHSRAIEISRYQEYGVGGEPNTKFNDAWGTLNGEEFSFRKNFYHKPVMSVNWDWETSENSSLSTILYGSWGRGGGTGPIGDVNNIRDYSYDLRDENGHVRFDDIATWNGGGSVPDFGPDRTSTINDRSNGMTRRASMNSHDWYGVIANFHKDASDNFSWDLGIDARTYKGFHYRVVNNIIGASGYTDDRDAFNPDRTITAFVDAEPSWNPWVNIKDQQKIEYHNDGGVRWLGSFGQVEYKTDNISAFLQAGFSSQSFQRIENFLDFSPDEPQESDWETLTGGNIKTGINWNINENHNIFGNAGYYSKQPLFNAVYPRFDTNATNEGLTNEKILGTEIGYGYRSSNYRMNLNLYRTSWKDRFSRTGSSNNGYLDLNGIEQVHMGIEIDGTLKFNKVSFDLMASAGDWEYKGDVTAKEYDQDNNEIGAGGTLYLDGVKVGDAAQFTARIGITYEITDNLKFDINQFFADKLYARIDAESFDEEGHQGSLELPSFSKIDAGISYKLNLNDDKNSLRFRLNVNNLANQIYISEAQTNYHIGDRGNTDTYNGINTSNRVYWGFGRTWNFSTRFNF